ncbi:response regulator transcription factor [Leucobacter luti]|uniref:Sensory transduction protein RegX3 n=1 Tax=Leucobacter luti TaxID=340320 RepID=A0A4Q7TY29_9MICO|nr:response regulator transcription factor [Leucobacter luti]MBL3698739.1 DNA-binding response regulator [Leucobacter luti]RZT66114.1 DNA-binding response OmpR family regulator [Leucobacter luti]
MDLLIVEDDRSLAEVLTTQLTRNGHTVTHVTRGSDALLRHAEADAVLLDLGLEDGDGFEVIRRMRQLGDTPIIVVTARGDERSTVLSLRLGADDYLIKPVRLRELIARIDVVARRTLAANERSERVLAGSLRIELAARRVLSGDSEIALTKTEFDLLAFLAQHLGAAVSREQILDTIWGDAFATKSRAFDVHLVALRQKLAGLATITTMRGYGYRLEA